MSDPGPARIEVVGGDPAVRAELQRIVEENGLLGAAEVVEAARPPGSPIHHRFTWDNTKAADRYRLLEAQRLIRSVKLRVVVQEPGRESFHTVLQRAYTSAQAVNAGPARSYVPTMELTPLEREIRVSQMKRELESLHRRFGHMREFWALLAELEQPPTAAA